MAPILKAFVGKFAKAAAFTLAAPGSTTIKPSTQNQNHQQQQQQPSQVSSTTSSSLYDNNHYYSLQKMCKLFKAEPIDNLYLSTSSEGGERGVRVNTPIQKGEPILSIPIASCFRDDEPPEWYEGGRDNNNSNSIDVIGERYNPSAWASSLAASLLDMELDLNHQAKEKEEGEHQDLKQGREIWSTLLPPKDILRASLPVHWGEEVLGTSKCTALEMAVDSAYFARAGAVLNLSEELRMATSTTYSELDENIRSKDGKTCDNDNVLDIISDMDGLQRKCHEALDIVQTRACRVERTCQDGVQWGPPLRILAPIFDFINHGSSHKPSSAQGSANAHFGIENIERLCDLNDARLVVRATRDVMAGEEVLIDYGDSARPAWRCLTSYGFVPEYDVDDVVAAEDVDDDEESEHYDENVAELWMNGLRFEVDTQSVPFDLAEVASAQSLLDSTAEDDDDDDGDNNSYKDEEEEGQEGMLTPKVARTIAKRATEAAFNLILEPEMVDSEEDWDSPEFVHAMSLAALLRWSQHRVLLAFADNLNLFSGASSSLTGASAAETASSSLEKE